MAFNHPDVIETFILLFFDISILPDTAAALKN